jgi:hypothetical protein
MTWVSYVDQKPESAFALAILRSGVRSSLGANFAAFFLVIYFYHFFDIPTYALFRNCLVCYFLAEEASQYSGDTLIPSVRNESMGLCKQNVKKGPAEDGRIERKRQDCFVVVIPVLMHLLFQAHRS